ncbi:MAG TPA: hypothetical protein VE985_08265 [Gaiellaceae bacterium]|nr:hypothetical protein [Gaiellaceae bacterium]
MTLITDALGLGVLRTGTELTVSWPAAGKTDSTGAGGGFGFFLVVVVVWVVVVVTVVPGEVLVVAAPPASARVGKTIAAENPAAASRTEAMTTRRLT